MVFRIEAFSPMLPAVGSSSKRNLVWVDREGKEEIVKAPPDAYQHPRISPDGRLLALTVESSGNIDIWIWDLVRETKSRLTFDEAGDGYPVWTSDGLRMAANCSTAMEMR
jgi:Tol biopolymer transport system component